MRKHILVVAVISLLAGSLACIHPFRFLVEPQTAIDTAVAMSDPGGCLHYVVLESINVTCSEGETAQLEGQLTNTGQGIAHGLQVVVQYDLRDTAAKNALCILSNSDSLAPGETSNVSCPTVDVKTEQDCYRYTAFVGCDSYELPQAGEEDDSEEPPAETGGGDEGGPEADQGRVQLPTSGVYRGTWESPYSTEDDNARSSITIDFSTRSFSYEQSGHVFKREFVGNTTLDWQYVVGGGQVREDGWLIGTMSWYRKEVYKLVEATTTEESGTREFVGYLASDLQSVWTCYFATDPDDTLYYPPSGEDLEWVYETAASCVAERGTPCCPTGSSGQTFDLH
jgi:hypothetical protein